MYVVINELQTELKLTLTRLCWQTQETLERHVWMCRPGGAGLHVQHEWAAGTMLPAVTKSLATKLN